MTKKKGSTTTVCPQLTAAGSKVVVVVVVVCAVVLTLAILLFHSDELKLIQSSNFTYQFRNNDFGDSNGFQPPPKIAFLFLTRKRLPLDFVWANFFKVFPAFPILIALFLF